ncbi:MAG: serine hydrolase domain-containing protein, partial [Ekhidna sp.]
MRQLKSKIATLLIFCASLNGNCFAQYESYKLGLGIKTERFIEPLQRHAYSIALRKGFYASGYIEQRGVNIKVSVISPDGKLLISQDKQKNINAPEPLAFGVKMDGVYTIEVIPAVGHVIETEIDRNGFIWDGERRVPYETINQPGVYSILLNSTTKEESIEGGIDEIFSHYNNKNYPGAAVGVVKNGEIVYEKGYGLANAEYNIPISPSTVFHIASVSKQFAAFALVHLHYQGELSLDDNIIKYIPELQIPQNITIRQMLTHTSGLRDQWILLALAGWRMDDVITQNQLLNIIYRQKELNFHPGERYSYSNTNYTLAAEIIERVSGKDLRQWTIENIFDPLGMNSTFFYNDHEELVRNRAYSYDDRSGELKKSNLNFANMGATSLFTTVHDFSKWLVNFEEMKVGNKEIFEMLTTKGVLNDGEKSHYALGVVVRDYKGYLIYNHSGVD